MNSSLPACHLASGTGTLLISNSLPTSLPLRCGHMIGLASVYQVSRIMSRVGTFLMEVDQDKSFGWKLDKFSPRCSSSVISSGVRLGFLLTRTPWLMRCPGSGTRQCVASSSAYVTLGEFHRQRSSSTPSCSPTPRSSSASCPTPKFSLQFLQVMASILQESRWAKNTTSTNNSHQKAFLDSTIP